MAQLFLPDGSIDTDYAPDYSTVVWDWCKWDHNKFLRGVRGMTATQIGVYALLLNEMYARGIPLGPASRQTTGQLARLCGVGPGPFVRITDGLVECRRMVRLKAGFWDERVEMVLRGRISEVSHNSQAGVLSGEKRKKNKGTIKRLSNDTRTPPPTEKQPSLEILRETEEGKELRSSPSKEEEEREREADEILGLVIAAVGLDEDSASAYWTDPAALAHVRSWLGLGLDAQRIVAVAGQTRKDHPEPPDGPKALDRAMQRAAQARRGAPVAKAAAAPADPRDALIRLADWIKSDRYVPPTAMTSTQRRGLLELGLVDEARLREKGL